MYLYYRESQAAGPPPLHLGISFDKYGLSPVTTLSRTKALDSTELIVIKRIFQRYDRRKDLRKSFIFRNEL